MFKSRSLHFGFFYNILLNVLIFLLNTVNNTSGIVTYGVNSMLTLKQET